MGDTDDEGTDNDTDENLAISSQHSGGSSFLGSPIRFVHSSPVSSSHTIASSPISNASTEIIHYSSPSPTSSPIMPLPDSSQSVSIFLG